MHVVYHRTLMYLSLRKVAEKLQTGTIDFRSPPSHQELLLLLQDSHKRNRKAFLPRWVFQGSRVQCELNFTQSNQVPNSLPVHHLLGPECWAFAKMQRIRVSFVQGSKNPGEVP
ncbi:hypothetical protein Bbelb_238780 [Branchiostoma belcheri]|nr:hypothetical protein Bbelb_238780 [Branchiostoma belcheri]